MSKTLPYRESTAFSVPLPSGGSALGVVGRMAPKGKLLLGYFFGPRKLNPEWDLQFIDPAQAVLVGRFGDLYLVEGRWQTIGLMPGWERSEWKIPEFLKRDPLGVIPDSVVVYDDTDISVQSRWETRASIPQGLAEDGLMGAGFVEKKLEKLLPAL